MVENAVIFFFSSRRRHTRLTCDWSSDVSSSDLGNFGQQFGRQGQPMPGQQQGQGQPAPGADPNALAQDQQGLREKLDKVIQGLSKNGVQMRSEERRVGKECRSEGGPKE